MDGNHLPRSEKEFCIQRFDYLVGAGAFLPPGPHFAMVARGAAAWPGRAGAEDHRQPSAPGARTQSGLKRDVILPKSRSVQCLAACTEARVFTKWDDAVR